MIQEKSYFYAMFLTKNMYMFSFSVFLLIFSFFILFFLVTFLIKVPMLSSLVDKNALSQLTLAVCSKKLFARKLKLKEI